MNQENKWLVKTPTIGKSGRLLLSHRVFFNNGIVNLDTSTLQTGIYTISLKGNNFTSPRSKFAIVK